jgi:hypothetical protein
MSLGIYVIRDKKAHAYMQPVTTRNDGTAIRMIQSSLQKGDTDLAKYPEDFALYRIGEFDEITGTIDALTDIICVGQLADLVINRNE